jgi:hypothetical protein
MSKKINKFFHQVPQTGEVSNWQLILNSLPEPDIEVDGMTFVQRVIKSTSEPNRKNANNATENVARVAGTGTRDETLLGSFEKGIDIREMPPKLVDNALYGGYGRHEIFDELKYKFWVYDEYEFCEECRNELQKSNLDVLEDAAISDNGNAKSKPASKADYVSILVKRIKNYGWNRDQMKAWFDSIDNCLTKANVKDYISAAIKQEKASGCVEWLPLHAVEQCVAKECPDITILNTTNAEKGNSQRFIRTLPAMMNAYISTQGKTQEYCLWNSQAESHQELDDSAKNMVNIMQNSVDLILKFAAAVNFYGTSPCKATKRITQKIGVDEKIGLVVDYD